MSDAASTTGSTATAAHSRRASWWAKTKTGSKSAFDKTWNTVDKLGAPVNRLSNRLGCEAFWPTTLDKESEKAARILKSFCKDGFYDEEIMKTTDGPTKKQRVVKKIPAEVIRKAKGLAIFTTMRTGLWISGAGGSGVVVARKDNGEWGLPIGIMLHTAAVGWLVGVDVYDCVLVLRTQKAVDAFSKWRATIGGEISAVAGPVGAGAMLETDFKKQAPIFTYLKSRGFYAGVQVDGTVVIERTDENERFYGHRYTTSQILNGQIHGNRDAELRMLMETLKAAQGDNADQELIRSLEPPPADFEVVSDEHYFGVPDKDDPDPYGVLALEKAGLEIREAGTQERPSAEAFEFKPSVHSPVHQAFRNSLDTVSNRSSLLGGTKSNYVTMDVSTQTDFDGTSSHRSSIPEDQVLDSEAFKPALPIRRGPPPPLPPRSTPSPQSIPVIEQVIPETDVERDEASFEEAREAADATILASHASTARVLQAVEEAEANGSLPKSPVVDDFDDVKLDDDAKVVEQQSLQTNDYAAFMQGLETTKSHEGKVAMPLVTAGQEVPEAKTSEQKASNNPSSHEEDDDDDEPIELASDEEAEIAVVQKAVTPQPVNMPSYLAKPRVVTVQARPTPRLPDRNPRRRLGSAQDDSDASSIRSFRSMETPTSPLANELHRDSSPSPSKMQFPGFTFSHLERSTSSELKHSDTSGTTPNSPHRERAESMTSVASSLHRPYSLDLPTAKEGYLLPGDIEESKPATLSPSPTTEATGPRISMANIRGSLRRGASEDDDDFS